MSVWQTHKAMRQDNKSPYLIRPLRIKARSFFDQRKVLLFHDHLVFGCCCSVTQSCLTLQSHGLQHARLLCPSLSPGVCSNSCPLSWWCHPTVSFSATLFFCAQSFPALRSFPLSRLFISGDRSIGASASASTLPVNIQGCFSLGLLVCSPCSPKDSQESSPEPQFIWSINSSVLSLLYGSTRTCVSDYWKNCSFDYTGLCQQSDISAFSYTV